jgi:hypothetical protein
MYPIGLPAEVVNVSETGMGIRTTLPVPVPSRQRFDIVFENKPPVSVSGEIVRCELDEDELHFTIGVRHLRPNRQFERIAKRWSTLDAGERADTSIARGKL